MQTVQNAFDAAHVSWIHFIRSLATNKCEKNAAQALSFLNALSILDKDEGVAIRGGRVDSTLLEGQSIVEADLQLAHTADSIVSYK